MQECIYPSMIILLPSQEVMKWRTDSPVGLMKSCGAAEELNLAPSAIRLLQTPSQVCSRQITAVKLIKALSCREYLDRQEAIQQGVKLLSQSCRPGFSPKFDA